MLNFGWYEGEEILERLRDDFLDAVESRLGLDLPDEAASRWPSMPIEEWAPQASVFKEIIESLLEKHGEPAHE